MNELPSGDEPSIIRMLLKVPLSIVPKIPNRFANKLSKLKIPKTAIAHMIDLTRDTFFLFELSLSQGGYFYMMAQSMPYIKGVSSLIFF